MAEKGQVNLVFHIGPSRSTGFLVAVPRATAREVGKVDLVPVGDDVTAARQGSVAPSPSVRHVGQVTLLKPVRRG